MTNSVYMLADPCKQLILLYNFLTRRKKLPYYYLNNLNYGYYECYYIFFMAGVDVYRNLEILRYV